MMIHFWLYRGSILDSIIKELQQIKNFTVRCNLLDSKMLR